MVQVMSIKEKRRQKISSRKKERVSWRGRAIVVNVSKELEKKMATVFFNVSCPYLNVLKMSLCALGQKYCSFFRSSRSLGPGLTKGLTQIS